MRAHLHPDALLLVLAAALASLPACDPPAAPREVRPVRPGDVPDARRPGPVAQPGASAANDAIVHRVSFASARNHYVNVEATFPAAGQDSIEVMMAVWTPGSYLVREFSRNVEGLAASANGEPMAVEKTRKNRWRVATGGADRVVVRYRLYAAELTVRTSWVGEEMAILNGAATFLTLVGDLERPHDVTLDLPEGWEESVTPLTPHAGGQRHRYVARDFDTLVDSPILAGNPVVRSFELDGARHRLALVGDTAAWDADRAARDVARLVQTQQAFWRQRPYTTYDFLCVMADGAGGGLEHLESSLLMSSPWAMRAKKTYASWLGLVSHELFHAWNVKRLRPAELGPFDYENEVYTRSLWVAEGVTSYYDDLLVLRAGLTERDAYLTSLSKQIETVETTPGRAVQSLAQSSYDTWIKQYRPDENSGNSAINYYPKGAVVGFLLDARIRAATEGRRSLDDFMRRAYQLHAGARGYTPEELRAVAEEIAGTSLVDFWRTAVDGTEALDYRPALDYFGLRFKPAKDADPVDEEPGDLGLDARSEGGRLRVTRVRRDGPGWRAGVQASDEILAIDDRRVPPDGLDAVLGRHRPGTRVTLLVSRWNVLRRLSAELGRAATGHELEVAPGASSAQRAHLAAWLGAAATR